MLSFILGSVIVFLICYMGLVMVGTFWKKQLNPQATTVECMRQFKLELACLLGEFFYARHVFDLSLQESFHSLFQAYSHAAFEIRYAVTLLHNVPAVCIQFIPNRHYTDEELQLLAKLAKVKFRQYLQYNRLHWKFFVEFCRLEESIVFRIYYEEFSFDTKPFRERYKAVIKEQAASDHGVLRDETLDKELRDVE